MTRPAVAIPEKLFFKIGEVCELTDVQAHVLRYWESEFPMLAPQKNRAGQRTYRKRDVEMVLRIKDLLYEDQYTIAGAKKKLSSELRGASKLKVVTPEMIAPSANVAAGIPTETVSPFGASASALPSSAVQSGVAPVAAGQRETFAARAYEESTDQQSASEIGTSQNPVRGETVRQLAQELRDLLKMMSVNDADLARRPK